ncbi:MAG: hypothetical protein CVU44_08325 [Chloroflexi bacterium HGW-Chloroflexi-6]|nr:MAG: hypothetical protein CVU44_08325 [Chloroflexi bacterium HGW-Chloroflexi-6]
MADDLGILLPTRKIGDEKFHINGEPIGFDVLSFWQWSASDLVSNATRGRLAEFLVAQALGIAMNVRDEWRAYDLEYAADLRIEVKSAAYLQGWSQRKLSDINFSISKTRKWEAETNRLSSEVKRQADIYIFALLFHKDKITLEPLNLGQWEFYVLSTSILNERKSGQKSISLKSLQELASPVRYDELKQVMENLAKNREVDA